jgi:hypothetical protein
MGRLIAAIAVVVLCFMLSACQWKFTDTYQGRPVAWCRVIRWHADAGLQGEVRSAVADIEANTPLRFAEDPNGPVSISWGYPHNDAIGLTTPAWAYGRFVWATVVIRPDAVALRQTVRHELGHVVGLDHVNDTGEVMGGRTDYGWGDYHGMQELAAHCE